MSIDQLSFARVLNHAYAVLVDEAATLGLTRHDLDQRLRTAWGTKPDEAPAGDDEMALKALMGEVTMEDLMAIAGDE